jgi:tetratricopeptide (TPR) repeat protein
MVSTAGPRLQTSTRDPLLSDLIDEVSRQLEAGEPVDLDAFIAAHPERADALRLVLPALAVLADLGRSAARDPRSGIDRPDSPLEPLGELGDFRLLREIGRGGMGVVYEAEQVSLGRRVALKLLPMAAALDPRQIQRFRVEAQAAACLHHPHIVPVHGVGCERGVHYYAMQLIEGRSLAAMIAELRRLDGLDPSDGPAPDLAAVPTTDLAARLLSGGAGGPDVPTVALPATVPPSPLAGEGGPQGRMTRLPNGQKPLTKSPSSTCTRNREYIRNAARLALQAAEALDHAHTRGILHRDIKPGNLLLDAEGRLWVTDFGLAQVRGDDRVTLTGDVLGTLRYMSPEQALGRRVVIDGRTDVYSLGVTLYELLTLRPAVDGRDRAEILRRIADGDPPPLRKINLAVPADLETIVLKATAKDPVGRYATAQELAEDLRNFLEDRPIRARRPTLAERARRWGRRHRTLAWSAAMTVLVAALMLAGGIGYVARDRAARLAQTGQRAAEALAGARTAIEARNLTLASQRIAEAQGRLGADGASLPALAAEIDAVRGEIDARQADADRFDRFLSRASDAQDKMSFGADQGGERVAEDALGLYGVLTEKDWLSRLDHSYLTAEEKQQVRETVFITLVSLADFGVRWQGLRKDPGAAARSLDLLDRAQAFHQPTRAFYFVRGQCRQLQGNTAAAAEDEKRFKAAAAQTAWDYYLPGFCWGSLLRPADEDIRSYHAALALQPNHYNSLFFLGLRLSISNRQAEAIGYFTACIALRPGHDLAYCYRAFCHSDLGHTDAAISDLEKALPLATKDSQRYMTLDTLCKLMFENGQHQQAQELLRRTIADQESLPEDPGVRVWIANCLNQLAWSLATCPVLRFREPAQAVALARKAVEISTRGDLAGRWNTLGVALYRAGDWEAAIAALEKSLGFERGDEAFNDLFLAMAQWQLGQRDKARAWYDKAVVWMETKERGNRELVRFRAEAASLLGMDNVPEDVFARP